MPSCLVEDENSMGLGGDLGCNFVEMKLHCFSVASWQHEGGAYSALRTDRTEQIGRLCALIVKSLGT